MKIFVRHIIFVLVLLFSMSYPSYGQEPCSPGQANCPGVGPPPPGLVVPIDTNLAYLLVAGLGLGIYFFVKSAKKKQLKN